MSAHRTFRCRQRWLGLPLLLLFLLDALLASGAEPGALRHRESAQRFVTQVEQLGEEYPEALEEGGRELAEQVERARTLVAEAEAAGLTGRFPVETLRRIEARVRTGVDAVGVREDCRRVVAAVVLEVGLPRAPRVPPSLAEGARVYRLACSACHGGDGGGFGPASRTQLPPPSSFLDSDRMNNLMPVRAFDVVTVGIPNTAMPSFRETLSGRERWAVAAYVMTLRFGECHGTTPRVSLTALFNTLDQEWIARFGEAALACLHPRGPGVRLSGSNLSTVR